ncbi:hypothetical protein HBH52_143920 [Parastagonospora nodorum]|nr:hypothetical protein HBH52_143920 [Parastagonospora nodorum]
MYTDFVAPPANHITSHFDSHLHFQHAFSLSLQVPFFRERLILLPFVIAIMSKDTSFRVCIAALLIVQIACWALALADLFIPGKPRLIIRTTMDVISQLFARRSAAMLQYRDFLAAF